MKKPLRFLAVVALTALALCALTACFQSTPTVINPVDDTEASTTTTEEILETRATVALPETRLTNRGLVDCTKFEFVDLIVD